MLTKLKDHLMHTLRDLGLPNVCDTAYALEVPGVVTPNFSAMAIELPSLAGTEVRVVGSFIAREHVGLSDLYTNADAGARKATRTLMLGMRDQAQKWLDEHPAVGV